MRIRIRPSVLMALVAVLFLGAVSLVLILLAATRTRAAVGKPELVRWEVTFRNASFAEDPNQLAFEGDIDERTFLGLAARQDWELAEISGEGVEFTRYSALIRLAGSPDAPKTRNRPYPDLALPPPEADVVRVVSGLHHAHRHPDGRSVTALYDRSTARAYIYTRLR